MRAISALGQNFLISPHSIKKTISAVQVVNPETVLEIGPGRGALTFPLARAVSRLYCVEVDSFLASELERKLQHEGINNVTVFNNDILNFDLDQIPEVFHAVGSLPYNISKRILSQLFVYDWEKLPSIHVIIQKEVAESYTTPPPTADFLYHFASIYSTPTLNFSIPKTHFKPIPAVDGACVSFEKKSPPEHHAEMSVFCKRIFGQPRKTLKNNLSPLLAQHKEKPLDTFEAVVDLSKRPAMLTHEELRDLFFVYNTLTTDGTKTT